MIRSDHRGGQDGQIQMAIPEPIGDPRNSEGQKEGVRSWNTQSFEKEIKPKKDWFVANIQAVVHPNTRWLFLGNMGVCADDCIYGVHQEDIAASGQLEIPLLTTYIVGVFPSSGESSQQAHRRSPPLQHLERNFIDFPFLGFPVLMACGITSLVQK